MPMVPNDAANRIVSRIKNRYPVATENTGEQLLSFWTDIVTEIINEVKKGEVLVDNKKGVIT